MISSRILTNAVRSNPSKAQQLVSSVLPKAHIAPTTTCTLSSHVSQLNQFTPSGFLLQPEVTTNSRVPIPNNFQISTGSDNEAEVLFDKVWSKFEIKLKRMQKSLPSDILWLIGAPGSGKGTVTPFILRAQSTSNPPICVSSLLQSPSLRAQVDAGRMIDDECVLEHLLDALLSRNPLEPLIIDGFPRTHRQVEFVSLLNQKLSNTSFKVAILYVSQSTSLARQLQRGLDTRLHNEKVRKSGHGKLWEERATDLDQNLVLTRYKAFAEHMEAIMALAHNFPFHMVNADCNLDKVVQNILHIFDPNYPTSSQSHSSPPSGLCLSQNSSSIHYDGF